jgi:hypothetical protein
MHIYKIERILMTKYPSYEEFYKFNGGIKLMYISIVDVVICPDE